MERLTCPIVRDLLPADIEGLTEAETHAAVEAHLAECGDCRTLRDRMTEDLSDKARPAPSRELGFLKKIRRIRVLAAVLCAVLAVLCALWVYGLEFDIAPDKAAISAALTARVAGDNRHAGEIYVLETLSDGRTLYCWFEDRAQEGVYGFAQLERGFTGKYRFRNMSRGPTDQLGVVEMKSAVIGGVDVLLLGGDGLSGVSSFAVCVGTDVHLPDRDQVFGRAIYPVENDQFLMTVPVEEIWQKTGLGAVEDGWQMRILPWIRLLDEAGEDITERFYLENRDTSTSWSSSTTNAEPGLVYFYVAVVLAFGAVLMRYFLLEDRDAEKRKRGEKDESVHAS